MTVCVDYDKLSPPTDEQLKQAQERIGKLLRRIRSGIIRTDGKKLTIQDVAGISGLSKVTIANCENGVAMSMNTMLVLFGLYKGLDGLGSMDLLDQVENNFVPVKILKKIAKTEKLTALEFIRTVSLFPEQEYEISYNAYLQIKALGFATRSVVKKSRNEYYASSVEYAKLHPNKKWNIAERVYQTGLVDADDTAKEFAQWASDTLREAVKDRPEFKHLV